MLARKASMGPAFGYREDGNMAEQKITVRLDPMQVNDLKQFVRDEIEKERRANMRTTTSVVGASEPVTFDSPQSKGGPMRLCVNNQRMPAWWPVDQSLPDGWLPVFTR